MSVRRVAKRIGLVLRDPAQWELCQAEPDHWQSRRRTTLRRVDPVAAAIRYKWAAPEWATALRALAMAYETAQLDSTARPTWSAGTPQRHSRDHLPRTHRVAAARATVARVEAALPPPAWQPVRDCLTGCLPPAPPRARRARGHALRQWLCIAARAMHA